MNDFFDLATWDDDGWRHPQPQPQVIAQARVVVTPQLIPPPAPPPPPPLPRPVYVRPPPSPPNTEDFFTALAVLAFGVVVIAFLTGFSAIWFGMVAAAVGVAALIFGFSLFMDWSGKFFYSRR